MTQSFLSIRAGTAILVAGTLVCVAGCRSTPQTFRNEAVSASRAVGPASASEESPLLSAPRPTARANDGMTVAPASTSEHVVPARSASPLAKLFDRFSRPKRIPLPRTDESVDDGPLAATGSAMPSLEDF